MSNVPLSKSSRNVEIPWFTWDAINDPVSRYIFFRGGIGSSKTTNMAVVHVDLCFKNAAPASSPIPSESWAVAQTHGKAVDTLIPAFQDRLWEVYGMQPGQHYSLATRSKGITLAFRDFKHEIVFKSGENEKMLAGTNITHFMITEAGLQPRAVFDRCVQRARSPHAKVVRGLIEGCPENDERAQWFEEWANYVGYNPELKSTVFELWTEDNPYLKPSTAEYIENLRRQYAWSSSRLESYLYGRFVRFDANSAYQFKDGRNKVRADAVSVSPHLPLLFAWDFNCSPLAWAVLQRQPVMRPDLSRGSRFVVLKESSGKSRGLMEGVAEFARQFPASRFGNVPVEVYGDASGWASSWKVDVSDYKQIQQYLHASGYHDVMLKAPTANPKVRARLEKTNALLSYGMLVVSDECTNSIQSLVRTSLKPGTVDISKPPGETVSHFADAISYCVTTCTRAENVMDPSDKPLAGFMI